MSQVVLAGAREWSGVVALDLLCRGDGPVRLARRRYWRWTRPNVISLLWDEAMPTGALTAEYWALVEDSRLPSQFLLAYSAYSVSGKGDDDEAYRSPNELAVMMSSSMIRVLVGGERFDCESELCRRPYAQAGAWHHVAVSWSADGGDVAVYVNGTLGGNGTFGSGGALPLQGGGVLHLGLEADGRWSDFERFRQFDGLADEVRIWSRALTGAEIGARYRTSLGTPDAFEDLALYYTFDEDVAGARDGSRHGRDGLWGAMRPPGRDGGARFDARLPKDVE